ncbi:unnamed protein product [Caenorhabditis auriculariae]|uniref:2-oxoisovalerate dehydrogenase subunit alpha n=1 Tax=Caenorhabditis auriculariae TaxID=2777116 RepID=A0A8S1GYJ4_9PELO|nr:unnamed protein product [Caenorhabditis auriculariae]
MVVDPHHRGEVTWGDKDHPISRFKRYITERGWWSESDEKEWQSESRKNVLTAFEKAEKTKLAHYHDMFEGVYENLPEKLRRQRAELDQHIEEYKDHYPMDRILPKNS